jgi:parallel beta-helix repeat protein
VTAGPDLGGRGKHVAALGALVLALSVVPVHAAPANLRSDGRCRGVNVVPGDDIQALIERHRRGATYCFRKGIYELSSTIWTGTKHPILDLRSGAIIDGQNSTFTGIIGDGGPDERRGTTILGGTFRDFGNAQAPLWATPVVMNDNWVVKGTEFTNNFNAGLAVQGDNARVSRVNTHHNGRYGLVVTPACSGCSGPKNVLIENSNIAFNNTRMLPTNDAAGGTKFSAGTNGMIVRGNTVHDNYGAGLWWDGFNTNARIYDNKIYDNLNWGIFWELSYGGAKIHHNTLTGNGEGGQTQWHDNVQLLVSCSDGSTGGIEIYANTIDGAAYPLALINHSAHPTRTRNVYVHDNTMTLRSTSSRVGATAFNGLTEIFSASANNRFEDNTYRVPDRTGAYWGWDGKTLTWSQWRRYGHDDNGVVR